MESTEMSCSSELLETVSEVATGQAVLAERMAGMEKSLNRIAKTQEELVQLRGETIRLMTKQEECLADRNVLFKRLRIIEGKKSCEDCQNNDRITAMENNQRWAVRIILGIILSSAMSALLIYPPK